MADKSGTWTRAQRRVAKDDGWRVWVKSKWTIYHVRRGCREQVIQYIYDASMNVTDGGAIGG